MNRYLTIGLALLLAPALHGQQTVWTISPLDSFANFSVRHLMISNVRGTMGGMKGTVVYDPKNPSKNSVEATLEVNTVTTGAAKRDQDLKDEYFDVKKFPEITFKSGKVVASGPRKFRMTGNLTIRGVTKQVVLNVEGPSPVVKDAQGRLKMAISATTKIRRKDFGIVGTALDGAVETGGIIVSDEVAIELDIELTPQ